MSTNGRPIPPMTEEDERRFWSKVGLPDPETGCMNWLASTNGKGYGRFCLGGAVYQAHRVSWTLANGPIPAGLVMDHLCRNHACVNPLHLEVVSQSENVVRGELWQRKVMTCPAGHAYTPENTYHGPPNKSHPNGQRMCRTCRREHDRARRLRKRLDRAA